MSYAFYELEVVRWAEARGIVQNSNIQAQARKTLEEAGELLEAATAFRVALQSDSDSLIEAWHEAYKDALGDVLVTLIVGAATADVDLMECLAQAYNEIKDRKGWLDAQGVFHKTA
jgi:NTP pyrophosphatase (non-canonical NTP hydrolase)